LLVLYDSRELIELLPRGFDDKVLRAELENFGNANDSAHDPWVVDIGKAYVSAGDEPHVFISMRNHCVPCEDLLRAEVLLGIGVMLTRFKVTSLMDHYVMPVSIYLPN
jgi:hypothetical protein